MLHVYMCLEHFPNKLKMNGFGLDLWYLTPLSTTFQLYHGVSFIGGGNRRTRWKPPTCRKSL